MNNKTDELTRSMLRRTARCFLAAATLMVVVCLNTPARADDQVPFKGTFDLTVLSVTAIDETHVLFEVDVKVRATQLGDAGGPGVFIMDPTTLSYAGEATWAAANGDILYSTFAGRLVPTAPGVLQNDETFEIVGGTGRFEGATGGGIAAGLIDADTLLPLEPAPFAGTVSSPGSHRN